MTDDGDTRQQSSRDELQPAPNATMWGFAIEVLHLLYRIGPASVVVAGFLVFGYFFYQEVNRAKEQADEQLLERLKTSQEQLVATYEKMGGMSDRLIENVKSLLDLSDRIDKDIETNRTRLERFEKAAEAEVREAEERALAVEGEITKKLTEAEAALAEAAARKDEMAAQQAVLARRESELQDQLAALEDLRKALDVQVAKLRNDRQKLQADLTDAATQIAQLRPEAAAASEGSGRPSADEMLHQLLAAIAADPRGANADEFNRLIGLDLSTVTSLAGANTDFAAWLQILPQVSEQAIADSDFGAVFGLIGDSEKHIDAVLLIESGQGRVTSVDIVYGVAATKLPKVDNWYGTWTVFLATMNDGLDVNYIDRDFGSWTLPEIIASDAQDIDMDVQVIAGSERRKSIASLSEVEALNREAYSEWAAGSDPFGRPAVILRMMQRAEDFRATSIPALDSMKPELREVFTRLVEAAVLDQREIVQEQVSTKIDRAKIGALAALVLRDDVRVDNVDESEVSDRGGTVIGQRAAVTLRFADPDAKGGSRSATLDFDRSSGQWMLVGISLYR